MFTLDTQRGDNTVAINVELPDGSENQVHLDFESEYTKQQVFRTLEVEQKGKWIVGVLEEDLLPLTGQYTVTVNDTVQDLLSLDEIHEPLDELDQPLNDIRGNARNEVIKIIRAVVYGEDYPFGEQPTEVTRTVTQPPKTEGFTQNTALTETITMPTQQGGYTQADSTDNTYYTE